MLVVKVQIKRLNNIALKKKFYLLKSKLLLWSHARHGVDHGGGQGRAGHHRMVRNCSHWRLCKSGLGVVRCLLVPLGCSRICHVGNWVLGGELEVGVHLLQLLQLVLDEADKALQVVAVSPSTIEAVDEMFLLLLANKEDSKHFNLTLATIVGWFSPPSWVGFHL